MNQKENDYIISGGEEGKKRLNVLADVMHPYTKSLLETTGALEGKKLLDIGSGGGHVALTAARLLGRSGHVTAIDFDAGIVELAKQDAAAHGIDNVGFMAGDAYQVNYENEFDIAYCRFLLSHLKEPVRVVKNMLKAVKPSGHVIVEDIDFNGHFCYPPCPAFARYVDLFIKAGTNNKQNPNIGPALLGLFHEAGVRDVQFDVIQPVFNTGPGKWMAYHTMDKITDAVLAQKLATKEEIQDILQELKTYTEDESTIMSLPRIFRVRGRKG